MHSTLSYRIPAVRRTLLPRLLSLLLSLVVTLASVADGLAQETGTITGVVYNASTRKILERAVVAVDGSAVSTLTDRDGRYVLVNVPVGSRTLIVSYADLDEARQTVVVSAGQTAKVDLELTSEEFYVLSEYTVAAEPEGNAHAVQQQRQADSQVTVVSADAFGIISDANPGEFLKNLPGLQMDYTGVEPRGIMVRGMETNLNLVMINGNQAAAAASSSTNRNFEFDQITIDNIESIEVYKAAIPSMPANSIGGTVNMVTRSAFMQKGRSVSATVNLTANSDGLTFSKTSGPNDKPSRKIHPGGSFSYSNSFLDGRLGVVFSLSQVNVNGFGGTAYNTYTYTGTPAAPTPYPDDVTGYVSQYRREDHQNFTSRTGGSLNFDLKVSDATTAFLRTTMTDHYYEFRNRFLILNTGTPVAGATPGRVEATNGNAQQNMSFGDKTSHALTINPGVKHRWDAWTVEYDATSSRATNKYDYLPRMFGGVTLQNSGVGFILEKDPGSAVATRITQTAGADIYRLASFRPTSNGYSLSKRSSVDHIYGGKARARREFAAKFPFYVELGGSYQRQDRERENPQRRWSYAGPDGIVGTADDTTNAHMEQFAERDYKPNIWFGERAPDSWISPFQLADFYGLAPQAFVEDLPFGYEQAYRNDQTISETIYAGYIMGNVKLGPVDLLVGTRIEQTYVDAQGAQQNNADVPAGVPPNSLEGMIAKYSRVYASNTYTSDPFKYIHLTWHATSNVQARASFAEAIGRPNFGSILPGTTINEAAQTVTANNTTLLPQRAKNYDASVEWYPSRSNSFTFAWFKKDIEDYINSDTVTITEPIPELGIGEDLLGYALTTSFNLGHANIEGFEFGGRYTFTFLPEWGKNLQVFGNYTRLYKTEGTFSSASSTTVYDQLPNLAPELWNLGFSYQTLGGKFFFQFKGNFVDDIPQNISGRPYQLKDHRLTFDAEIRYRISSQYTLSLAGRNVTEAEEGESQFGRATRTGTGGGAALTMTLGARF